MNPAKERRRWLKYVAKSGVYEKAVAIDGVVERWEYYAIYDRITLETERKFLEDGKTVRVKGYARLRTDRSYYPRCGKYGIPDDRQSVLAKEYNDGLWRNADIYWSIIQKRKMRKQEEEIEEMQRIEAIHKNHMYFLGADLWDSHLAGFLGVKKNECSKEILELKKEVLITKRIVRYIEEKTKPTRKPRK